MIRWQQPTMDRVRIPPHSVPGCMDPSAANYDPLATAAMDRVRIPSLLSWNLYGPALQRMYDPLAATDNGSCTYPPCPWVHGPVCNKL
jgi:hypothetical protein